MAENLGKRPSKGILKTSSSFEKPDAPKRKQKETKWDEMNIIATLHPPDKEYGHMKIKEPKTPFNWLDPTPTRFTLDAGLLVEKIRAEATKPPRSIEEHTESEEEESEEETEDVKAKRVAFESKRKTHYNEYYAVKLARKLMEQDKDVEEESEQDEAGEEIEQEEAGMDMDQEGKHAQQKTKDSSSASNMNCVTLPTATGHCS